MFIKFINYLDHIIKSQWKEQFPFTFHLYLKYFTIKNNSLDKNWDWQEIVPLNYSLK